MENRRRYNKVVKIDGETAYLQHPNGGKVFLIDAEDVKRVLDAACWRVQDRGSKGCYVTAHIQGHTVQLHRFITDFKFRLVDHINRDTLDNRKSNLRASDLRHNRLNSKDLDYFTNYEFIGIYYHKSKQVWIAQSSISGKNVTICSIKDKFIAALRYDEYMLGFGITDDLNICSKISESQIIEKLEGAYRYKFRNIYKFFRERER